MVVSVKHNVAFYERNALRVREELETLARNEAPGLQADTIQPLSAPADGEQQAPAADGTGETVTTTDSVNLNQVAGKSIIIHEKPDNFANIPERYAPEGPDEDTRSTGDAGSRLACGVIE